jgi:hypothetical protein
MQTQSMWQSILIPLRKEQATQPRIPLPFCQNFHNPSQIVKIEFQEADAEVLRGLLCICTNETEVCELEKVGSEE